MKSDGTAVLATAAVLFGIGGAVLNIGAKRVFWLLLGFHLGRRKARRVKS